MCIAIALQLFHSKESLRAIPDEFQWLARACNDPNLLTVPFSVEASHKPSWSGCAIREYCFPMARQPGAIGINSYKPTSCTDPLGAHLDYFRIADKALVSPLPKEIAAFLLDCR